MTQNDKKMNKVKNLRCALDCLMTALVAYEEENMHVEAMNLDAFIVMRRQELDFYIAKNFPIVEVR